jgi:hypothetical protein
MLERLLDSGVEVGWFTADETYGDNPGLRPGWKPAACTTSWRCPAIAGSPPRPDRGGLMN